MPFKLFEFLERFTTGAFLITLIQLEKNGSTGKVYSAENLKIKFHFRNYVHQYFKTFSWKKKQKKISKTYKRVFTTFVTLNK